MEFKLSMGDPKTGKTVKKVISDKAAEFFLKKVIGDKVKGDDFGFEGYEFQITGGSDYCGFPMRKDVRGFARKRILIVSGIGIRKKKRQGRKVRKTVAGNTIYAKTAQINLKILKAGSKPLAEEAPKEGDAPKEAEKPKAPEAKAEAPKEEKKAEVKKEEKKEEKKEDKPKEEKKPEPPKEKPKKEEPKPTEKKE